MCLALLWAGCRAKPKEKRPEAAKGPAAEVRQAIPAPTLTPPAPEPAEKAALAKPRPPEEVPPAPKGPVTVVPPPEGAPPTLPEAPIAPAPPEAAVKSAAPPAAGAGPAAPPEMPAPLAMLPGEKPPPKPEEGVQALAAPGLAPPPEAKKPEAAQPVLYEPKLVKAQTNIELILDASGSMAAPFATTATSKFDMLKTALYDIVAEMGRQQAEFPRNIAIRVYGAKSPVSENDRQDTRLLAPMGAPDLGGIRSVLDPVKAQGLSPIALSIAQSPQDYPDVPADRVVVLVADGADNAEGDPCAATAKIEEGAIKTTVHVVAFDISPADQAPLECIAKKGDGKFHLARNENELRASLDEAISSTVPYNLKLSARVGATPIPFDITVFRAGTEEAVRRDKSFGTKLLKLDPASYDILVEYPWPEKRRPSKILKGVEILATTKVEQTIGFDLGQLTLTALNNEGNPSAARFEILKGGTTEVVANVETGAEPASYFITPGSYDITADLIEAQVEEFALSEKGVEVRIGEATDRTFRFQKGSMALKGITTQKEAIPFTFQACKAGKPDQLVASGALPSDGGSVLLAPGGYDLLVTGADPKMTYNPRTKISGVEIRAAETTDLTVNFEMGIMKLAAINGKGGKLPAEFVVRDHATQAEMGRAVSEGGDPVQVPIPPGNYDIVASSIKSILEPKPSVPVTGVTVTAEKPVEQTIKFILGTLRLRGRNAKEQPIQTQFSIYKAGTEEKVSTAPASGDWTVFDLAPGTYDALALNTMSEEKPQPMIWLRDLSVEDGKTVSHESIFTAGKLKIIGRGPNNQVITCHFKVFQYGADREFINGVTGSDWGVFEIQPGNYYLEASYHDDIASVMLKKWINIKVGENEVVEEVLRF